MERGNYGKLRESLGSSSEIDFRANFADFKRSISNDSGEVLVQGNYGKLDEVIQDPFNDSGEIKINSNKKVDTGQYFGVKEEDLAYEYEDTVIGNDVFNEKTTEELIDRHVELVSQNVGTFQDLLEQAHTDEDLDKVTFLTVYLYPRCIIIFFGVSKL